MDGRDGKETHKRISLTEALHRISLTERRRSSLTEAGRRSSITEGKRRLSINEMEMARQYSEASARISAALERRGKKTEGTEDLKRELEMWEHKVTVRELAKRLGTDETYGLTSAEAKARLERDGPNVLSPPKVTPWWIKLAKQFGNFFAVLLQIASVLCFVGYGLNREAVDNLYLGVVLYAVVIVTAIFSFFQEYKSEKTMEKFKNFLPPSSVVHRGKVTMEIPAAELVVGDLIEIKLGDKIPADVRIIGNQKLKVDNSPLTGESEPIGRTVDMTDENPLETKNLAFFGTLAVDGTAQGLVVSTGDDTVFGRIAGLAAGSVSESTTLQHDIHHFVIIISSVAIFLGVLFFLINLGKKTEIIRNIVFCIGIIVANVPEGLLATVTVSLTLSAKRMARKNVLVKKLEAVETLGSTTCICSDKTGTLTQNRMTIVHVAYNKELHTTRTAATEETFDRESKCFKDLFFIAACCGTAVFDAIDMEQYPDKSIDERKVNGDASEAGILKFSEKLQSVVDFRNAHPKLSGIPFNSTNKFMVTINNDTPPDGGKYHLRLCMKGAPERVLDRCSHILTEEGEVPLDKESRATIDEQLSFMMERGERVLGFAQEHLDDEIFTPGYEFDTDNPNFPLNDLTFVGLMALLDPPREAVPHAVQTCQTAGIKVIMVTGDHPATAKSIAKQVNIIRDPTADELAKERGIPPDEIDISEIKSIVVPGSQIKDLEQDDWDRVLSHDQIVFARTSPQQKLIIVENNQRLNNVVAVTGDGVNDSPALKKANIGIAMGISGSDVSKEAADMVLLDDNFASIVNGVEEGRLIFDNLKKSIAYTLTSNIPEIVPFLTFITVQLPQPLTTILILCIDLGTDLLPAVSLAYEEAESDIMRRPPRDSRKDRLVNRRLISFSYFQIGVIQAIAGFYTYIVVWNDFGVPPSELPFLDQESYFESQRGEDKRWLFTEQENLQVNAFRASWFDRKDLGGAFSDFPPNNGEGLVFDDLLPGSPANPNQRFTQMVQTIARAIDRPPCLSFTCGGQNNDISCLLGPTEPSSFEFTGINTGETNQLVDPGQGPGQGCFELWTVSQQDEVLKRAQTAFFVSIVIVQIGGLLVCKTRVLSWFQQGMRNMVLNVGIIEELLLCAGLCYIPGVQSALQTRPLLAVHWVTATPFMLFIFVYDEVRKWLIRRHDRHGNKLGRWLRDNTYW